MARICLLRLLNHANNIIAESPQVLVEDQVPDGPGDAHHEGEDVECDYDQLTLVHVQGMNVPLCLRLIQIKVWVVLISWLHVL